jgi:hypothetical protein
VIYWSTSGSNFFAAGHATSRTPEPLSLVQNSWFKTTGSR